MTDTKDHDGTFDETIIRKQSSRKIFKKYQLSIIFLISSIGLAFILAISSFFNNSYAETLLATSILLFAISFVFIAFLSKKIWKLQSKLSYEAVVERNKKR